MRLYHGSIFANITELLANSTLHENANQKVVYLTDNIPYALLYIWDSNRNFKQGKHVTAWIKENQVFYEEQFQNQLRTFYDGVSGYLYAVNNTTSFSPVNNREAMWFSPNNTKIDIVKYIPNVYDELCKYINSGELKVIHFEDVDSERVNDLYNCIVDRIISKHLLENPDDSDAVFYQKFFLEAWELAKSKNV
ncbi:MAG: hypothetical protein IKY21_00180 [Clostridia bacterium]|nr:hypothetical protein [Clostridia bacterium]